MKPTTAAGRINLLTPPRDLFEDPKLKMLTPLTVTRDGRVVGHLAGWGIPHTGFDGQTILAPRSRHKYAFFHTGSTDTAEGDLVRVGRLAIATGHAGLGLDAVHAAAHYDNTGTAAAVVRAGEDKFGIWVAGTITPDSTPEQVAALRRSPLSGDWRTIRGSLELIGALAVNTPGFPIPAYAMTAAGGALVAAGCVLRSMTPADRLLASIYAQARHTMMTAVMESEEAHVWMR